MPTINDATVVNSAYDTSGNGGRKLVRLSNGWLISVVAQSTSSPKTVYFYKSTDNGSTWSQLCYIQHTSGGTNDITYPSITSKDNFVYCTFVRNNNVFCSVSINAETQTNVNVYANRVEIATTITNAYNSSIAISGNEIHVTYDAVAPSYPNSRNIFYAKGTINGDGSVTWGAVEQITTINSLNGYVQNPSITFNSSNQPVILGEWRISTTYEIHAYYKSGSSWVDKIVYTAAGSYAQSSPSAIFVPQSVNGLANGRIWVAWHGRDATDSSVDNIRVAYSDNGGETWSSMTKLTSGNSHGQSYASITANKNNEIFILWTGRDSSDTYNDIRMIKYNGSWGSVSIVSTGTTNHKYYPSALVDTTLIFSSPLFIYQDNQGSKVGFYGTWVVTTISVPQGDIGQKTSADKNNLLSYNITTDGTMSDITEKINGTVVNTRTSPTSGQEFTVSLTQEQWDAIKYGKYKDATGGLNTLTIEMGSDIFTYTFDKQLASTDDVLSAVKAVQDSQQVLLPAVKAKLGAAIRGKGGTVNDTDSWDVMAAAVGGITVPKKASGTISGSGILTVTGLSFRPKIVYIYTTQGGNPVTSPFAYICLIDTAQLPQNYYYSGWGKIAELFAHGNNSLNAGISETNRITSDGFTFLNYQSQSVTWIAFE